MAKIVIIGASLSGYTLASRIRQLDKDIQLGLISEEDHLPYDRQKLPDFLSGALKEEELFFSGENFYLQERIEFIRARRVSLVNPQRHTIYFKEKGTLEYDFLAIASGRKIELPDIPGIRKNGVFNLYSLDDFKALQGYPLTAAVCVVGCGPAALKLAGLISAKSKVEVKIISESRLELPADFSGGQVEIIQSLPQEVIGEGKTDALKLKTGKVIGACAILFLDGLRPNSDFLKNSGIDLHSDGSVLVDSAMRTNIRDIFACGAACRQRESGKIIDNRQDVLSSSMLLADNLLKATKGEVCQTF